MENCLFCASSQLFFFLYTLFSSQWLYVCVCVRSWRYSHVQIATFKYHRKVKFSRCRSFDCIHFSIFFSVVFRSLFHLMNLIIFTKTIFVYVFSVTELIVCKCGF